MAQTDPEVATIDVLALAWSLRSDGAPVTVDDIADAARGLARLGSADPELVAGVLDATLGKYGPPGRIPEAVRLATSMDDDGVEQLVVGAPSSGSREVDGSDDRVPSATPTSRDRLPGPTNDAGESVTVDLAADAASLDAQLGRQGSACEDLVALVEPGAAPTWRFQPNELAERPPTWSGQIHRRTPPLQTSEREPLDMRGTATAVRALTRSWNGAPSRLRPARTGSIELRRTLLRACRSGGPLLPAARRRRGRHRPAAVVVLDLSPSVRGTTSVPAAVAHRLARTGRQIRVFAATDRLTEVTSVFRRSDVGQGLARLVSSAQLDPTAASDWGRVLRELERRFAARARPIHLLVLGDGRSVGAPDGVGSLQRIAQRAASVRWATPEPPAAWALGSAEPARYAQVVDDMVTVRTLADVALLARNEKFVARNENHS